MIILIFLSNGPEFDPDSGRLFLFCFLLINFNFILETHSESLIDIEGFALWLSIFSFLLTFISSKLNASLHRKALSLGYGRSLSKSILEATSWLNLSTLMAVYGLATFGVINCTLKFKRKQLNYLDLLLISLSFFFVVSTSNIN